MHIVYFISFLLQSHSLAAFIINRIQVVNQQCNQSALVELMQMLFVYSNVNFVSLNLLLVLSAC